MGLAAERMNLRFFWAYRGVDVLVGWERWEWMVYLWLEVSLRVGCREVAGQSQAARRLVGRDLGVGVGSGGCVL